jgi:DNA-binding NtrC family response regulator
MDKPYVMLVDDEVSFVETTAKRLAIKDLEIVTAFSAEEGLKKLKAHQNLDVIVLDMKMPGMDGIEALKEFKTLSPVIEVIMLTGHGTMELAIEAMKRGAYDFLIKPFDIEELLIHIKKAAQKKREHQEKIETAIKQETLSKYGAFKYI